VAHAVLRRLGPAVPGRGLLDAHADKIAEHLSETFGLPRAVALSYGRWLYHHYYGEPSVRDWLGT
jgi:hypothetical protein